MFGVGFLTEEKAQGKKVLCPRGGGREWIFQTQSLSFHPHQEHPGREGDQGEKKIQAGRILQWVSPGTRNSGPSKAILYFNPPWSLGGKVVEKEKEEGEHILAMCEGQILLNTFPSWKKGKWGRFPNERRKQQDCFFQFPFSNPREKRKK